MFCYKCSGALENEKCSGCKKEVELEKKQEGSYYNYWLEEDIILLRVPVVNMRSGSMFISVFAKNDHRRNYKGYDFIIRPSEFSQDPNKEMHIHVLGEKGSMKVRLNPVERDKSQLSSIPPNLERKLVRFIADNTIDIKRRIREKKY